MGSLGVTWGHKNYLGSLTKWVPWPIRSVSFNNSPAAWLTESFVSPTWAAILKPAFFALSSSKKYYSNVLDDVAFMYQPSIIASFWSLHLGFPETSIPMVRFRSKVNAIFKTDVTWSKLRLRSIDGRYLAIISNSVFAFFIPSKTAFPYHSERGVDLN